MFFVGKYQILMVGMIQECGGGLKELLSFY
jgi:hypothetical protein